MFLVFDLGGTNVRIATSTDGQGFENLRVFPTPQNYLEGLKLFENYKNEFAPAGVEAVAGGLAGPLNKDKFELVGGPNIPDWIGRPIQKDLGVIFGARVFLKNDALMGAIGEATCGVAKDFKIVAYLALGTGIGGAKIVNGSPDEAVFGFEPEHQFIASNNGSLITAGQYIGELLRDLSSDSHELPAGLEERIAVILNNLTVLWAPEIIVLGGGVVLGKNVSSERIREHLKKMIKIFPEPPQIALAKLGDAAGLRGALSVLEKNK